jgi:hypothetical protein
MRLGLPASAAKQTGTFSSEQPSGRSDPIRRDLSLLDYYWAIFFVIILLVVSHASLAVGTG